MLVHMAFIVGPALSKVAQRNPEAKAVGKESLEFFQKISGQKNWPPTKNQRDAILKEYDDMAKAAREALESMPTMN
jgi:hypothetical protein